MTTLTKNNDKLEYDELEHDKLSLHGMNLTSKEKPKWWECGGHVRGKKQSRDSDDAGERGRASGASGQDVTEKDKPKSTKFACELAGHRPGMMSEFGGIAGSWLAQPQQGAAAQTKEAARVADVEARGLAPQTAAEAPNQKEPKEQTAEAETEEQKIAEATTEEQETKGTKAEKQTPQSVLLDTAAIKSEPATYAEACGAKSTVKVKEQEAAKAKPEEQEKGIKAKELKPKSVPLHLKSKPTTYGDSCGTESVAPLKRRSVKAKREVTGALVRSGQVQKVFAQHNTFGIKLEIDKKFLDYAYTSAETVANGSAESGASSEAEMQAAKMAAAVKEQAKAKRAAEAKAKAKAMAKAKAKAKAKALEKEERHLLAEAARAAKAAAVEAEAEAEVETSKRVQKPPRTAKEPDGAAKAAEEAAKAAEVAARPLVQVQVELKKGQTIMVNVDLQMTATILHEVVSNRSGMPPEGFAIYYRSKQLEGEAALSSWGVEKNATIEVKTRGRGGAREGGHTEAAQIYKVAGAAEAAKAKDEKNAKAEEAKKEKEAKAKVDGGATAAKRDANAVEEDKSAAEEDASEAAAEDATEPAAEVAKAKVAMEAKDSRGSAMFFNFFERIGGRRSSSKAKVTRFPLSSNTGTTSPSAKKAPVVTPSQNNQFNFSNLQVNETPSQNDQFNFSNLRVNEALQVKDIGYEKPLQVKDIGYKKPLFEFATDAILGDKKLAEVREYSLSKLGSDDSSAHFIHRTKNIAFVVISNDNVFSLEQNFFVQHDGYNDFSGGLKREYTKIQDSDLQYLFKSSVLAFKEYYNLPDHAIILLQVQTSSITPEDLPEDLDKMSVTGQGIHTDGANLAALVCIHRQNVKGALNTFHDNLLGSQPLCEPTVLEPGKIAYFKDNSLYHHVSKAVPDDPSSSMTRSILLMHYPADMYLVGAKNDSNDKGTQISPVKMRVTTGVEI